MPGDTRLAHAQRKGNMTSQREGGHLQVKGGLRRHQPCWHPDLEPPASRLHDNTCLLFKPPSLWCLVTAALVHSGMGRVSSYLYLKAFRKDGKDQDSVQTATRKVKAASPGSPQLDSRQQAGPSTARSPRGLPGHHHPAPVDPSREWCWVSWPVQPSMGVLKDLKSLRAVHHHPAMTNAQRKTAVFLKGLECLLRKPRPNSPKALYYTIKYISQDVDVPVALNCSPLLCLSREVVVVNKWTNVKTFPLFSQYFFYSCVKNYKILMNTCRKKGTRHTGGIANVY